MDWFFAGGGIGATLRFVFSTAAARAFGTGLPVGTFLINLVGCLAMGFISEYWASRAGLSPDVRLFLTTGLLGGFTTFSSFALESVMLGGRGEALWAFTYAAGSVVLGIACAVGGILLARAAC